MNTTDKTLTLNIVMYQLDKEDEEENLWCFLEVQLKYMRHFWIDWFYPDYYNYENFMNLTKNTVVQMDRKQFQYLKNVKILCTVNGEYGYFDMDNLSFCSLKNYRLSLSVCDDNLLTSITDLQIKYNSMVIEVVVPNDCYQEQREKQEQQEQQKTT